MTSFTGLNGDVAFRAKDVPVGRVSGEPYARKRSLLVTVSIHMEWLTRQDEYETVTHELVRRPLDFAITTGVWNTSRTDIVEGGATVEPLRNLVSYENGFTQADVARLVSLDRWHLSGTRPGCVHQKRDAGLDSPPCPVTGYQWGRKWLVETLPDGLLEEMQRLFRDRDGLHDV